MLKNLLMSFLIRFQKPLSIKPEAKYAVLVHELGELQVFHLLKESERPRQQSIIPYEVYWQNKYHKFVYGPFVDTYSAMQHYTLMKDPPTITPHKGSVASVIEVDFKAKKRKNN